VLTIYDAARCPYCARVRIVLAEKEIEHELFQCNLDERPAFLYELNPPAGRVPILEEEAFVLPESAVIMDYLEERFPEPELLPRDAADRARVRLAIHRFDAWLGDAYYDLYFKRANGSAERVHAALAALDERLSGQAYLGGPEYSLADVAYVPWAFRAETRLGLDLSPNESLSAWLERLLERPAVAAEREVVAAL
jgi:glutathione S-transferase